MKKLIKFKSPVAITAWASVAGKKEGEGPIGNGFDQVSNDDYFGMETWEQAETELQQRAVDILLNKRGLAKSDIALCLGGDLCNQITSTSYTMRELATPFLGLYGACSTMAESMLVGACMVDGGYAQNALALASSHFCTAERQFRTPLDYGGKRTPTAQWTVTGCGTVLLETQGKDAFITHGMIGSVVDYAIKDVNNMGAAMAPAAAQTIRDFLQESGTAPEDYDMIFTGDLGACGTALLKQLLNAEGITVKNHNDCGLIVFDKDRQHVQSGASGCGCGASVLTSVILPKFSSGEYSNVLFVATGALMSPTTSLQGESIPSIAHLVNIQSKQRAKG
ncbi:MAG: stage V sporulation protein AD [Oscillospiraceae bacterium]